MLDKPPRSGQASDQLRSMAFAIPTWPTGIWGLGLPSAPNWGGKAVEGFAIVGNEWVDFVSRRVKEDLNLLPRLAACKCPEEVSDVYVSFWRNLGDDYGKEFAMLTKLVGEFAAGTMTAGTQQAS